jgi:hypothetical protein
VVHDVTSCSLVDNYISEAHLGLFFVPNEEGHMFHSVPWALHDITSRNRRLIKSMLAEKWSSSGKALACVQDEIFSNFGRDRPALRLMKSLLQTKQKIVGIVT